MKKDFNLWGKLRSATRAVWMYSPQHRLPLMKIRQKDPEQGFFFECSLCKRQWPVQMAAIDHDPPVGAFDSWDSYADWCRRLFEGPVRVIDKICHKKVTAAQRRKKCS